MLKFPDNTARLLIEGLWRIQLKSYESQTPYLRAKIEIKKDVAEDSLQLELDLARKLGVHPQRLVIEYIPRRLEL